MQSPLVANWKAYWSIGNFAVVQYSVLGWLFPTYVKFLIISASGEPSSMISQQSQFKAPALKPNLI